MNYQVQWDEDAILELQTLYDAALDKEAIRHAVVRAGLELSEIPREAGESRGGRRRILFKYPLVLWYIVSERLQQVTVTHVRMLRA